MTLQRRFGRSREVHSYNHQIGQDKPVVLPDFLDDYEPPEIEQVDGPKIGSFAEAEAFMHEPVTIVVHDTTDKNAVPMPCVRINGRSQYFIRGKPQVVKRKFVARLAQMKHTSYTQTTEYDRGTGNVRQAMNPHTALALPFSVIHDANPNGAAWLQKLLNEGR